MTSAEQKKLYRKFFRAGMKCNELHPDDSTYDSIHFEKLYDKIMQKNLPTALKTAADCINIVFIRHPKWKTEQCVLTLNQALIAIDIYHEQFVGL